MISTITLKLKASLKKTISLSPNSASQTFYNQIEKSKPGDKLSLTNLSTQPRFKHNPPKLAFPKLPYVQTWPRFDITIAYVIEKGSSLLKVN